VGLRRGAWGVRVSTFCNKLQPKGKQSYHGFALRSSDPSSADLAVLFVDLWF
jgi:hypothetical protein